MFKLEDFENGMVVELENGNKRLFWDGRFIDEFGYIPIENYNEALNNIDTVGDGDNIKRIYTCDNVGYFKAFFRDENLTEIWNRYDNSKFKNLYKELLDDIDRVMMAISVRKTEHSKIAFDEKMNQPNFSDLNWCFDQLFYLKQNNK